QAATATSRAILELREAHRELVGANKLGAAGYQLIDQLFRQPVSTIQLVAKHLDCSFNKASRLVERLVELGVLEETTGHQRNRRYRYMPYLTLFASFGNRPSGTEPDIQTTQSDSASEVASAEPL